MYRKKVCPCGQKSIPGLIQSVSLCQEHYNGLMFAPDDSEEYKQGVRMLNLSKQGRSIAPNDMTLQKQKEN